MRIGLIATSVLLFGCAQTQQKSDTFTNRRGDAPIETSTAPQVRISGETTIRYGSTGR